MNQDLSDSDLNLEDPEYLFLLGDTTFDMARKSNELDDQGEVLNNLQIAAGFYVRALELLGCNDLPRIREVLIRARIGDCYYQLWSSIPCDSEAIAEKGIQSNEWASKSMFEYEHALFLDCLSGFQWVNDISTRSLELKNLRRLWTLQGLYLKNIHGAKLARHYLLSKVKQLELLNIDYCSLCSTIAYTYLAEKEMDKGKYWLIRAINCTDYDQPELIYDKEGALEYYNELFTN